MPSGLFMPWLVWPHPLLRTTLVEAQTDKNNPLTAVTTLTLYSTSVVTQHQVMSWLSQAATGRGPARPRSPRPCRAACPDPPAP